MSTPAGSARFLVGEALSAMGRLRTAWPWLAQMLTPGRVLPVIRPPDERLIARARDSARWAMDRHAALEAIRAGRVPAGPRPEVARASVVDARARIAADVAALTARLLDTAVDRDTRAHLIQPTRLPVTRRCTRCAGTGTTRPPAWWDHDTRPWPPPIKGTPDGEAGPDIPCRYCRDGWAVALVAFDRADALMLTSLAILGELLPNLASDLHAADAMRILDRAALLAHRVCGVGEDRRLLAAPCPSCQRRTLYAEVSSINRAEWTVRCGHPLCECKGSGCRCGRPKHVRRGARGKRHLWPAAEWDGPAGLAARLGVVLPGTLRQPGPDVVAGDDQADARQYTAATVRRRRRTPTMLDCACHVGGAYPPPCSIVGGCGSAGCACRARQEAAS